MNAIVILHDADYKLDHNEITLEEYSKLIKPLEDVVQIVHGKWIGCDTQCGIACSVCGTPVDGFCGSIDYIHLSYEPDFCPHCGAIMDGEQYD